MPGTSSRMLALLSLLQSRRDWPGQVLAARLEVTVRTVRRDVDRLRELGYSIAAVKGPDGGYRLAAGTELPPLLFDDQQAVAIAVALQNAPSSGVDLDEAAARALTTVKQVMPSRLRHRVERIQFTDAGTAARVDPAVLETVSAAARDHRILRFSYGEDWSVPPRRVEPHAVIARRSRWYLVAWDLEKADWRIYRLDRMAPKPPAGAVFAPRPVPGGSAGSFLSYRMKGSEDGDAWPCRGELLIELPASEIAPWIGDGELEEVSATACRVRVGSWSWAGLLSWVLRFDAPFTVLGPDAFIDSLAGFADGILAARPGGSRR
ncbi:WYL domain-containing protein [Arthrobacter gandavensis]|uniref:helix-turn-helix transcriptional regulator n=1 Tax=Arthrobacter gandavensis TaxID=169960 RepID=UPI0018900816|nr:WYL domain-containing protein [Arthrobacter gandavensis]MBF4992698.1 WYL domain-containing protein [Arthrobacter gandavensis]